MADLGQGENAGAGTGAGTNALSALLQYLKGGDIAMAAIVMATVMMMVVPIPSIILDILLALNLAFSLAILLVTMYITEPLEFSVFPSLLLIVTLFRLSLNVSATKLILLKGNAGSVIEAFGNFVVGGNYIVGLVIFLILVIIQFVVITNGAGRVAEVAARFTLDAMPGKQMSIDADLNAGMITEDQARRRRLKIQQEADFYGAMDGSSKFVRGDAIAGIIIIAINIVGGILIGIVQLGIPAMEAFERFALLTVGDGLVNQIPALLISTATGIVVTRAASESDLGHDFQAQMLAQPKAVGIAAVLLFAIGLVPGLPKVPFLLLGGTAAWYAYGLAKKAKEKEEGPPDEGVPVRPTSDEGEDVMALLRVETMELNFGYALIPLVDVDQGGDLKDRVAAVRRQIALELGILVPSVRIRDGVQARPNEYIVKIKGVEVARGEVIPDCFMAMNPGTATGDIDGSPTREPAFGLPAVWVAGARRSEAEMMGYTVVDPASVIATHLSEIIKAHAPELLSRQDTRNLVDNVKKTSPAVVEELIPAQMSVGEVQRVLQNLVRERISIRDLTTILEALGDASGAYKDVDALTEYVRSRLGRSICAQYAGPDGMSVLTIEPSLEQQLLESLDITEHGAYLAPEPKVYRALMSSLASESERMAASGLQPMVLTASNLRPHFRRLIERAAPAVVVLSYTEVVPEVRVNAVGMVSLGNAG
ncbi:MAG: flagellar biosynthesis protein FlhA [Clostridia bacterium]|nr:flagellar biosynthesis protein FlhA [Clostridia bacterium]